MKHPFSILCLSLLLAVLGLPSALGKDAPTSEAQFLKEFEGAVKAKDTNAFISLYCDQGVSAKMKALFVQSAGWTLSNEVKSVKLLPLPAGFRATNEVRGVRYTLNVSVVGLVEVEYQPKGNLRSGSMNMPYGKKDGAFYIAGTIEEKLAEPPR